MNKPVQILLLIALLPMIGTAREETLEQRKQRIMRKYMRESLAITQSDMVVPTDLAEDERVTDSKKYLEAEVDFEKEDATISPMRPPSRPLPVARESNWLLDDTEEMDDASDPYADPFASSSIDSSENRWSTWDNTSSDKRATGTSRQDRSYNPYARENQTQQEYSANGQQQGSRFGSSSTYSSRTDLFGQSRQSDRSTAGSGFNLQGNKSRKYGSDPSEGMLGSSYSQPTTSSSQKEDNTPRSYQPYKSPYDQQREQRAQQGGGQVQQPKQEYNRSGDSYQKFKDRNKTWDPMQDDAYISETMQKPKR